MKLTKGQIAAITSTIVEKQKKNFEIAKNSKEFDVIERQIFNEFNKSEAKRKLDLLEKAQKVAGDLELIVRMTPEDTDLLRCGMSKTLSEWNFRFNEEIGLQAILQLKKEYCASEEKIETQIVLATIDASSLEELIHTVTLRLSA